MDISSLITALITGGLALIGVIITVRQGNDRMTAELRQHQAVQELQVQPDLIAMCMAKSYGITSARSVRVLQHLM